MSIRTETVSSAATEGNGMTNLETVLARPQTELAGTLRESSTGNRASQLASQWLQFGIVAAEFGLLVLIIRMFHIESAGFGDLAMLTWAGFLVHHFLPLPMRLPFFSLLSLAGL